MAPENAPYAERRAAAFAGAAREGTAGLLVSGRANVRYLSGFSGSNGWLLLRAGERPVLLTDGRYREQAAAEAPGCDLEVCADGLSRGLEPLLAGGVDVALEAAHLTHAAAGEIRKRLPRLRWRATQGIVEGLRSRKDAAEVARIRRALALAEGVLAGAAATLDASATEDALAALLEYTCRVQGAERMAFETIVAGGAHAALPHARPRPGRPLDPGLPVVVDLGCVVGGYCSDLTRCVVAGRPLAARWERIREAVSRARAAAIAAVRPGVPCRDVDAAARRVLAAEGLEHAFVHSLGHGVGLEVHEAPRLAAASDDVLAEGMVVTIEPGVYLPGEGGLRLEDMVVVTAHGAERLNALDDAPLGLPCD